jgi:hypothetical protein
MMKKTLLALTLVVGVGSLSAGKFDKLKDFGLSTFELGKSHPVHSAAIAVWAINAGDLAIECYADKTGEKWETVKNLLAAWPKFDKEVISKAWADGYQRFVIQTAALYGIAAAEVVYFVGKGLSSIEYRKLWKKLNETKGNPVPGNTGAKQQ